MARKGSFPRQTSTVRSELRFWGRRVKVRPDMSSRLLFLSTLLPLAAACAAHTGADDGSADASESPVTVDTSTSATRAQYDANVAFVTAYRSKCDAGTGASASKPRVLLTGFGRFESVVDNATGRLVEEIVPGATYPVTAPPASGVDDPAPQLRVASADIDLPGVGSVRVCGMILPVYWDVAAALVAREADAFAPDLVLMNGVAGDRQPIWIELGGVNRAARLEDGSNVLTPTGRGVGDVPLIETAPASESALGNLLTFDAVKNAATAELATIASEDARSGETPLANILLGAIRTSYPRSTNTYLCNNVTYTVNYLMSHSGPTAPSVTLLRASKSVRGSANSVPVRIARDMTAVPHGFVHWPSELGAAEVPRAARVLRAMLAAQLAASARGDAAARGNNHDADDTVVGGPTF